MESMVDLVYAQRYPVVLGADPLLQDRHVGVFGTCWGLGEVQDIRDILRSCLPIPVSWVHTWSQMSPEYPRYPEVLLKLV